MQERIKGTKSMAQRAVNAREWLVDLLAESASIPTEDARKAADYYTKHKIAKLDIQMSRYKFSSGQFLEPEVIKTAANMEG